MKKVAIVTIIGNYNIGNKLQNYAVLRSYEKLGMSGSTITYNLSEIEASGKKENILKEIVKKCLCIIGIQSESVIQYRLKRKREVVFQNFTEEYLHPAEVVSFTKIPKNLVERYDYFSVGSDQVWHNWTNTKEELEYFFLTFCDRKKRLNIAPSFGHEMLPEKWEPIYIDGLKGFAHLSCRESSGVNIIKKLTGKDAELLIDPTMSIGKSEWENIEKRPIYDVPQRYIIAYFLGNGKEQMIERVYEYAEQMKCNVINIYDIVNSKKYYVTGPREFLYLIHNAELVCSNSFHAIAFSIIYNKNFICFERSRNEGNMNGRIITLLDKFGLRTRLDSNVNIDNLLDIEYKNINLILASERNKYVNYLKKILE